MRLPVNLSEAVDAGSSELSHLAFYFGQWFLVIMAALGVGLRTSVLVPIAGFDYGHVLHAHSHVGFLGWIFNAFLGLALACFMPFTDWVRFRTIFIVAQVGVVGMLISYPIQGYGPVSIAFSTLHMSCAVLFAWRLWRRNTAHAEARGYLKWALGFMVISGLGPLALGPLAALGWRESPVYLLAIYFYLHFQYNGWFVFFLLAVFQQQRTSGGATPRSVEVRWPLASLATGTVLTFAQSTLWLAPSGWVFGLAGVGGALQLVGFGGLMQSWRRTALRDAGPGDQLFKLAWGAFGLKLALQFMMAWPGMAAMANSRFTVIAFLHLVFLFVVTPVLWAWSLQWGWVTLTRRVKWGLGGWLGGAVATESLLIAVPLSVEIDPVWLLKLLLAAAVAMLVGAVLMIGRRPAATKSPSG